MGADAADDRKRLSDEQLTAGQNLNKTPARGVTVSGE
jgi:hypothetical protein